MTKATVGDFDIEVFADHYRGASVDNSQKYDQIFRAVEGDGFYKALGVRVLEADTAIRAVLITAPGGGTGIHKCAVIFEENRAVLCCGNFIFCLSVPKLDRIWKTECDMATCFGIFAYKDDYIVHGELEISRLSHDGRLAWQQGGADIFTKIKVDDFITATDFYDGKYQFDFEGKLLSYTGVESK